MSDTSIIGTEIKNRVIVAVCLEPETMKRCVYCWRVPTTAWFMDGRMCAVGGMPAYLMPEEAIRMFTNEQKVRTGSTGDPWMYNSWGKSGWIKAPDCIAGLVEAWEFTHEELDAHEVRQAAIMSRCANGDVPEWSANRVPVTKATDIRYDRLAWMAQFEPERKRIEMENDERVEREREAYWKERGIRRGETRPPSPHRGPPIGFWLFLAVFGAFVALIAALVCMNH